MICCDTVETITETGAKSKLKFSAGRLTAASIYAAVGAAIGIFVI